MNDPAALKDAHVDRASLRRAWGFARPYRGKLLAYLGVIVVVSVVAVLPPLVFKRLIDNAIPRKDLREVTLLFVVAVFLALLQTGLNLLGRWYSAMIGEGLIYDMRTRLYEHVQRMPMAFFTRVQTGSLLSRLSNDVLGAQQTVSTLSSVVSDIFTLVTVIGVMVVLSWQVTIATLIVVPLFIVLDRKLGQRLAALSRKQMMANATMSTNMTERFNVAGAQVVKLFGRPRREAMEFRSRAGEVRDAGVQIAMTGRIYYGALALVGSLGVAAVYWLGGRAVIEGSMTIGTLTALAAYVARLYSPLTDLASTRVDLLTALVSFDRVFEVLDRPSTIVDAPGAVALTAPAGQVDVEDVWFRYPAGSEVSIPSLEADASAALSSEPSDWILRGVSFSAAPGTTVALVGPSGAGKTTLTSLVPRLYDVSSGAVRIDGRDVRSVTLQSLADAIGVVSQDPHLFHVSIAENLRYAKPEATNEELVEACRAARIHDVIAALPDGYDTIVGERGYRLSGGEKQRLAIARVLLKNPAIVVLDEATSHLDSENEAQIQRALAAALAGRTAIVIAHRLSTIRSADQILVMEGGQIVERGTHDSLVASGGLYR
ncbi:MAG TPA: ABC transporter ATP-binding protein, partial [Acidimicrobiales bacterium]|nr:ABC transporter ATP-binding protein [Acidimicrobiales bacterium]